MQPIYEQNFVVDDLAVDCFGRLKPSMLLYYLQEVAGNHFKLLEDPTDPIAGKHLFWAVSRHRVKINRLPRLGETVRVETWPMPTTRVAYPRAMAMYSLTGELLAQSISLWVLMDGESRAMVLPGKSGGLVEGTQRGTELDIPKSPAVKELPRVCCRDVTYSLLDTNGHMNNTRYLDWVDDLLSAQFHRTHAVSEFVICYLNEARENDRLSLHWGVSENGVLLVDSHREGAEGTEKNSRVFTAQVLFST